MPLRARRAQKADSGVQIDGSQHGVGIYYRACANAASSATGTISGNDVENYQKGGTVASCSGTSVQIRDSIVTGLDEVGFIAQNGIEVGFGATASVMRNTVSDNQCTGSSAFSSGILVVDNSYTTGAKVHANVAP